MKNTVKSSLLGGPKSFFNLNISFRLFSSLTGLVFLTAAICNPLAAESTGSNFVDIGTRRELFVDNFIIDKLSGKADVKLHHPVVKNVALVHNEEWEGNTSGYHSIFLDGNLFRMYYRGSQISLSKDKNAELEAHPFYYCYAESDDGINWRKPNIGLFKFKGSKNNNIVLASGEIGGLQLNMGDNATMFKDENPDAAPDARYKAVVCAEGGSSGEPRGLFAFKSSDAIHWLPMSKEPVITQGAFDSQNVAFWDNDNGVYRAYWRYFDRGTSTNPYVGVRSIRTATSKDFINWSQITDVIYADNLSIELYTNQIKNYYRAPHLFIGIPTRYIERGWSPSMEALPELEHRKLRSSHNLRYGTALTDAMLMASRDGIQFTRWAESFLPPGIEREGTWNYGHHYLAWGIVETKSDLKGAANELSFYSTENSWTSNAPTSDLRRFTLRLDGFASVRAPMSGGALLTRPLHFQGKKLSLNMATSAAGSLRVEITDAKGNPLPSFTKDDCYPVFGDTIERIVIWKNGSDVSSLIGKTVRLRFILEDADLFSFQFQQ